MPTIKSYSVSNGDMFYIKHDTSNFTVIDCNIIPEREDEIINELKSIKADKDIFRFISTHPDEDHISGIELIDEKVYINNFYSVDNKATKKDETNSFKYYCKLRDSDRNCSIERGLKRAFINKSGNGSDGNYIGSSGIHFLWPDIDNPNYKDVLIKAKDGEQHNNLSPIIEYITSDNHSFLWLGDMESSFMENNEAAILKDIDKVNVIFAPHHGRKSGIITDAIIEKLSPDLIVIGEADSSDLYYYPNHNHITQNKLGDIVFKTTPGGIDIYATKYEKYEFLSYLGKSDCDGLVYIGTLVL